MYVSSYPSRVASFLYMLESRGCAVGKLKGAQIFFYAATDDFLAAACQLGRRVTFILSVVLAYPGSTVDELIVE